MVDERHVLTAEHVVRGGEQVVVRFLSGPAAGVDCPAALVKLGCGFSLDVAVLDVGEPRPERWPRAVSVWPARRLPREVSVLGFPAAEGREPVGVWRRFAVAGSVAGGLVQLDWAGEVGTLPGHSGGPVVVADSESGVDGGLGALVGILVQGSEAGRFDRFVPVSLIAECWPALPRPWLMSGLEPRSHFTRRATGQRGRVRGGDFFRGRGAALAALRTWLTSDACRGQPLVIIGQPGAGKSSVLARVALALERAHVAPGLAFHASGRTHEELLQSLAALAGYDAELSRDAVLDAVSELSVRSSRFLVVVLDALDEAAGESHRREIAQTLCELGALEQVTVAVATRPLAAGDRYASGALLPVLGVRSADSDALMDLDTDRYFDPEC